MLWPCYCHAIAVAMVLSCYCHDIGFAMLMQCYCILLSLRSLFLILFPFPAPIFLCPPGSAFSFRDFPASSFIAPPCCFSCSSLALPLLPASTPLRVLPSASRSLSSLTCLLLFLTSPSSCPHSPPAHLLCSCRRKRVAFGDGSRCRRLELSWPRRGHRGCGW